MNCRCYCHLTSVPRSTLWIIIVVCCGCTSFSDSRTPFLIGCNPIFQTANTAKPWVMLLTNCQKQHLCPPPHLHNSCRQPDWQLWSHLPSICWWHAPVYNDQPTFIRPFGSFVCLRRFSDMLSPRERFTPQTKQDRGNHNRNQAADHEIWSVVEHCNCRFQTCCSLTCSSFSVTLDSQLTFDDHVSGVFRECNFHTKVLRHNCPLITKEMAKVITCSIVESRLDYCNSVLYNIGSNIKLSTAGADLWLSPTVMLHTHRPQCSLTDHCTSYRLIERIIFNPLDAKFFFAKLL